MRVLVVPKWYPWPELPVFGLFCREHAAALATRHDVVVLATLFTPDPPDFRVFKLTDEVEDGLRVLRVRYRRPYLRPLALVCQLIGMAAAVRRLRREGWRPDVVHAHVYSAALPALAVGRASRALVAVTEHYTGFGRGLITGSERRLARFAFERADVVAPVSHELEGTLRELAPKANFVVVPNTVDTGAFEPPPQRPAGLRLLNVAALAEKKGHGFLLEALAELPEEATLDIAGDGELRGDLEARVRELGLADRVTFLGEQPKHEVARLMRDADLFVLPSLAENLPVVLIEAMASGLPAVATSVGGVPEMLGDEDGVLVDPGDPAALAAAIRTAATRDFDSQAMAVRARDRYSYAAVCGRWSEIYAELASRRGSSSSATRRATASSE